MRVARGTAVMGICLTASIATADIAYDNLTNIPYQGGYATGRTETAQPLRLAPGAGLVLTELSMEFRNATSNNQESGTIRMSVYADADGMPGAVLAQETFDYQLDRGTSRVYSIDIDEVVAPNRRVWAAWRMDPGIRTIVVCGGEPDVGSTSNRLFYRSDGVGEWLDGGFWNQDPFHIQITTVPAPGVLVLMAPGLLGGRRRR